MAEEPSHSEIKSAITWLRWAVVGLGAIGAFALLLMQQELSDSSAAIGRIDANVTRSIDNLSGTMSTTNSVLQTAVVRLEGIAEMTKRNADDLRRHEGLSNGRAHDK